VGSFERALIVSAKTDRMSDDSRKRLYARLAVTAGSVTIASSSAKIAATVKAAAHGAAWMSIKWLAIGISASLVVGSLVRVSRTPGTAARLSTPGAEQRSEPATPDETPTASRSSPDVTALAPTIPTAKPVPLTQSTVERRQRETLALETKTLRDVQTLIDGGDSASGLRVLDEYAMRFPHGALLLEASVLRIEALVMSGRGSSARVLGDRFLRDQPGSPYRRRVAALLASIDEQN